jgi:hypothetical protein
MHLRFFYGRKHHLHFCQEAASVKLATVARTGGRRGPQLMG